MYRMDLLPVEVVVLGYRDSRTNSKKENPAIAAGFSFYAFLMPGFRRFVS